MNPDCCIEGCERAQYRSGLCRSHYELRPRESRYAAAMENMMRNHHAALEHRQAVVAEVQAIVDAQTP